MIEVQEKWIWTDILILQIWIDIEKSRGIVNMWNVYALYERMSGML